MKIKAVFRNSYLAERRFKEIGIRKVMGASVPQIVAMMSAEFLKLVLIAFCNCCSHSVVRYG